MSPAGRAKAQWKPDWALRWAALGVDYEMSGKDHIDNVRISSQICRVLGGTPPDGFNYELFLDDKSQKISKSKGNGLTIDEWLSYAGPESLALFMFQKPREAKRLHFDVIPRAVDDYLQFLGGYERQDWKNRLGNPVWHIHGGNPPPPETIGEAGERTAISFALLLNLVAVANADSKAVLWAFLRRYAPSATPQTHPRLDALVGYAIRYFRDFVKPAKRYHEPTAAEREALEKLVSDPGHAARGRRGRCDPGCRLRCRPVAAAISGPEGQGRDAGAAGRVARLVQHALPHPSRRAARAALRVVRGDLRLGRDA